MCRTTFTAVLAVATALRAGCARGEEPVRSNLIVIVIDAQRADRLSAYGAPRETSPAIARLAAGGVRFTRAMAPSNRTGTSMSSIWTGQLPSRHGVFRRGEVLRDDFVTVAEALRANGYRTGAWCPNPSLHRRFGLSQGWDVYDDEIVRWHSDVGWKRFETASTINKRALAWIDQDPQTPFLAWLHYRDVHGPYLPPPPFDQFFPSEPKRPISFLDRLLRPDYLTLANDGDDLGHYLAQYDGETRYTDGRIDEFLAELARRDLLTRSVIVLTADHGEAFLDHGQWNHDVTLYEEELHVPLVIVRPGAPAGVVTQLVSTVDLYPTLLTLAGVAAPASDGASLLPLLDAGDGARHRPHAFAESMIKRWWGGMQRSVRRDDTKVIVSEWDFWPWRRAELYDLAADPRELHDLSWREPGQTRELVGVLDAQLATMAGSASAAAAPLDGGLKRKLEALGYAN